MSELMPEKIRIFWLKHLKEIKNRIKFGILSQQSVSFGF